MSPLIYARHHCIPAADPKVATMSAEALVGAIWQCPECQSYWKPRNGQRHRISDPITFEWVCIGRPAENAVARNMEAHIEGNSALPTPTVAETVVQLVIGTYMAHMALVPDDDKSVLGVCGECAAGIFGPHTIQVHAREKAIAALQEALAAGDAR